MNTRLSLRWQLSVVNRHASPRLLSAFYLHNPARKNNTQETLHLGNRMPGTTPISSAIAPWAIGKFVSGVLHVHMYRQPLKWVQVKAPVRLCQMKTRLASVAQVFRRAALKESRR